ncbi:hypothetical protein ACTXT7_011562 [Hymenolepis weldensis]
MTDVQLGRCVIIPIDGSSLCHRAFNWFLKFAYRPNDFIYFAHVMHPKMAAHKMVFTLERPTEFISQNFSGDYDEASQLMNEYSKLAKAANIASSSEILAGSSVADAILKMAAERQANLIVVPTRGNESVKRTLIGDVSKHLVSHSSFPVLVVPPIPRKMSLTLA